jgi:type IV secretory pathway VirJ component
MKFTPKRLVSVLFSLILPFIIWWIYTHPPLLHKTLSDDKYGDWVIAKPLWGAKASVLVFADSRKYPPLVLGQRLAKLGVTVFLLDSGRFLSGFNASSEGCLDTEHLRTAISELLNKQADLLEKHQIISGISEGALLPFVNALQAPVAEQNNISVDFSVKLPSEIAFCPPLVIQHQVQDWILQHSTPVLGQWRSVWTDQPQDETAVFVRSLGNVDTRIADYEAPLDNVLVEQVQLTIGQNSMATGMPVVEVPVSKPSESATIFYSGDGGWRDLDRTVAGEMAKQNQPVLGVDVLKYFWQHKSAAEAAADLSATMQYYRQHWGIKNFVLAGYSFGADILPAVYNQLPPADKDSVRLLTLLALSNHADFEIHVSGWIGKDTNEQLIAPELAQIPKQKLLCIYGVEEKAETACLQLENTQAHIIELPGGHHFDEDYPKLTRLILQVYQQVGLI